MAFVANLDEHGNEIRRIMLYPEPRPTTKGFWYPGRYDHLNRFHFFAYDNRSQDVRMLRAEHMEQQDKRHRRRQLLLMHKNDQDPEKPQAKKSQPEQLEMEKSQPEKCASNLKDQMKETRKSVGASKNSPFYSWLAAKNEAQQQEAFDRRLIAQLDDQVALQRAKLAEVKYQHWYQTKTRLRRSKSEMSSTPHSSRQSISAAEAHGHLLAWEREKLGELRAQRLEREERQARQQLIETTRRELNSGAYAQWKAAARNRPKPVAMGRGLDSLRATNAPHYTNPKEWQSLSVSTAHHTPLKPMEKTQQRSVPDYERLHRLSQPRQRVQVANRNRHNDCLKQVQSCPISTVKNRRSAGELGVTRKTEHQKKGQLEMLGAKPEQPEENVEEKKMKSIRGQKKSNTQPVRQAAKADMNQLAKLLNGKSLPMQVERKHETLKDCVQQDAVPVNNKTELKKEQQSAIYNNEVEVEVAGQVAKSQTQLGGRVYGGASQPQPSRIKVRNFKENQKSKPWR